MSILQTTSSAIGSISPHLACEPCRRPLRVVQRLSQAVFLLHEDPNVWHRPNQIFSNLNMTPLAETDQSGGLAPGAGQVASKKLLRPPSMSEDPPTDCEAGHTIRFLCHASLPGERGPPTRREGKKSLQYHNNIDKPNAHRPNILGCRPSRRHDAHNLATSNPTTTRKMSQPIQSLSMSYCNCIACVQSHLQQVPSNI